MGPSAAAAAAAAASSHNPGRERAIEALIDREPHGDYCRAVRVVDEAFTVAQSSRPNLITRAALVDQAFSLAVHDVDTLAKYDLHLSEEFDASISTATSVATPSTVQSPGKKVDALTRERIFHYQAKVLSAKLNPKPRSNSCDDPADRKNDIANNLHQRTPSLSAIPTGGTCSPPATLVAALRRVYDDGTLPVVLPPVTPTSDSAAPKQKAKHAFELRQLLQAVSSHSVFHSSTASSSDGLNSKNPQANLEKLILNVAKLATDPNADSESSLQALLVAILSLSTSTQQQQTEVAPVEKIGASLDETEQAKTKQSAPSKDDDVPFQSVLQVGALLSLFNVNTTSTTTSLSLDTENQERINDTGGAAAAIASSSDAVTYDVCHVDPALLEYFSATAAVYEERWEIQMARMLARMQTPLPPSTDTSNRPDTPSMDLVRSTPVSQGVDDVETPELGDSERIPAETPTSGDQGGPDMDVSQTSARPVTVAADGDSLVLNVEADAPTSASIVDDEVEEPRNEIVDDDDDEDDHDESSDSESGDEAAIIDRDAEMEERDVERHDEPYESNSDSVMDDAASGNEDGEQPDNDEAGDDSSSSSESSDDEGIEIGDSDGVSLDESEDGEEAILHQALALSMVVQQEAAVVASRTEGTTELPDSSSSLVAITSTDDEIHGGENVSSELAASMSVVVGPGHENEEEDEANLPSYPDPPANAQCSYQSAASSTSNASDDPLFSRSSKTPLPLCNPADFGEFGAVPVSHVLLHLLRYTTSLVDQRVSINSSSVKPFTVVVGGMGSSFLALDQQSQQKSSDAYDSAKVDVTLQLLVASFLLLMETRNDAVANLLKAISNEQSVARGGNLDCGENDDADDDSSGLALPSGEEDDPALTLAMNYVEDDAPLSSESLENKGMMRKAAAAAHDALAMMKSLRKRTDAWKLEVKLMSSLVASSMRVLRQFLRSVVRTAFVSSTSSKLKKCLMSVLELQHCIPPLVASRLSASLEALTTVTLQNAHATAFGGDETEFERLFQTHCLFREGISLWGECIPLMYTSETARSELLGGMLDRLKVSTSLNLATDVQVAAFPASDVESSVHKIRVLCRRLRVNDLLDGFVSKPVPFVATDNLELDENGERSRVMKILSSDPFLSSSLVTQMCEFLTCLESGCTEIHRLYLALCHRYHSRTLLLDGFYAASTTESGRISASASSRILSTGDLVRVASGPSTALQFDGTNCSDSIALLSGFGDDSATGTGSVHQRASKVWGTVLSTHQFSPKTGVHRWAVKLDKCERGHVFIGVATTQASTRTYVGGDKYGWGMIGTQALWHDRRKIRGDYGATFRTGSTIIVTLDTDIGTLSFSSWKDCSNSSSYSLDPLVSNIMSPRRSGQVGGTIDNWGVAFEGLPLDAKLYPAVGLYQRDDRVTLLTVEANENAVDGGLSEVSGGDCYYPSRCLAFGGVKVSEYASRIRRFNDLLTWDGIRYATETLEHSMKVLKANHSSDFVVTNLLPSLGAAVCLLPATIPVLSTRCSLFLSSSLSDCIVELQGVIDQSQEIGLASRPGIAVGKWYITTTGLMGSAPKMEQYVVDFTQENDDGYSVGLSGTGTNINGRLKNGSVKILGCCQGSLLSFVEDWTVAQTEDPPTSTADGFSSYLISARLSIDGTKFEGMIRNAQSGSIGQIFGVASERSVCIIPSDIPLSRSDGIVCLKMCGMVLCLALSHVVNMLGDNGDNAAGDLEDSSHLSISASKEDQAKQRAMKCLLSRPLLSCTSLSASSRSFDSEVKALKDLYGPPVDVIHPRTLRTAALDLLEQLETPNIDGAVASPMITETVAEVDDTIALESGGLGSLRSLCSTKYVEARRLVTSALLFHCRVYDRIGVTKDINDLPFAIREEMRCVWRASLNIMECKIRRTLSLASVKSGKERCTETCNLVIETSKFLLQLEIEGGTGNAISIEEAIAELTGLYALVDSNGHLACLRSQMLSATKGGLLRLLSLHEVGKLARSIGTRNVGFIETLLVGLPQQLGRGKLECNQAYVDNVHSVDVVPDLDGTYLSRLSGLDLRIKLALKGEVSALLRHYGQVTDSVISLPTTQNATCLHDSVLISFLSSFIGQFRQGDIHNILSESRVLSLLQKVISSHRDVMMYIPNAHASADAKDVVHFVQEIFRRDVSRAVLRCAVAAFHIIIHHISSSSSEMRHVGSIDTCSDLLLTELALTLPYIEGASLSFLSDAVARRSEEEWMHWQSSHFPGQKDEVAIQSSNFLTCLWHLRDHGCLSVHSQSPGQLQKASSRAASSRSGHDNLNKNASAFGHQLLAHWLDILCAFLRSRNSISTFTGDRRWIAILFKFVGLSVENNSSGEILAVKLRSHEGGILPARFRSRVLRLMLPLLLALEPNQTIVNGIFHLAGVTSSLVTQSQDIEESFVSREAISLLRQLHLPCNSAWREIINNAIHVLTIAPGHDSWFCKKIGLLSFFSGSLETIGRGSFILMKSAASSALSPDHQTTSSSKSHPNGIGGGTVSAPAAGATPHHLVGNGTISVVAGFSRLETSAGIVSNIDIKSGICEVMLISRDLKDGSDFSPTSDANAHRSVGNGSRQALTVRAVRAPLVDVVHAQEVPLFLDSSIPVENLIGSILNSSLESLLSATLLKKVEDPPTPKSRVDLKPTNDVDGDSQPVRGDLTSTSTSVPHQGGENPDSHSVDSCELSADQNDASSVGRVDDDAKSIRSGVLGLSCDMMTLRCCVVLLSDKRVVSSLSDRAGILAHVLNLAWPNDTGANASFLRSLRNQSLSSLPVHEATFGHLVSLLRDLNFRMLVMKQMPTAKRETMLDRFRSLMEREANQPTESKLLATHQLANSSKDLPSRQMTTGDSSQVAESSATRAVSSSTGASNSDDEESEAAATAASHLQEAAIAQMAELGLPRAWSELALRRTGGINIEAAVTFCLERGSDIERMLAEEQVSGRVSRDSGDGSSRGRRNHDIGPTNRLLRQLLEMGFPKRWCAEALAVTGNDVDEALSWILNNGERLSEEDERMEAADDDNDGDSVDEDEDETEADDNRSDGETVGSKEPESVPDEIKASSDSKVSKPCWTGSVIPLRFISGRAIVDPVTMELAGLPNGGFSSVGTKGILHTNGKWYYEAVLETAGCLQIGWADGSFVGHCHADRGDGCGDGPSSWAYDGWRRYRWHATATEWGCRWKQGDVVGCLVDMDERIVAFTLNGQAESIGMGVAFTKEGFRPCGGVYACVSFNRREKLRFILGGSGSEPFKYGPPSGYRGVGEAVLEAVKERDHLLSMESVLDVHAKDEPCSESPKRFLCDFSDGDHGHELMSWAHRYYGSDASVHLGSSRSKAISSKSSVGASLSESKKASFLTRRLLKAWSAQGTSGSVSKESSCDEIYASLFHGYEEVQKRLTFELFNECLAVAALQCRKLLLHLLITEGSDFNPNFLSTGEHNSYDGAVKLWNVIEACTSLRSAGWVGEAGAMAISAEAVGLGISSNEQMQTRSNGHRTGAASTSNVDEGLHLPTGGYTQVLSSVLLADFDSKMKSTDLLPASCAEAAMGSEGGGGILAFLQKGLQGAVSRSPELRCVLTAATRRAIRLLAVVEYDGDDFDTSDRYNNDPGENQLSRATLNESAKLDSSTHEDETNVQPDARLASFVTGLLLSKPIQLSSCELGLLQLDLFEAWSAGLLSSSLPFRMICALTVAGILSLNPSIFAGAFKQTPTLARYFGRLQSTVARRIWAERAAAPVCSRYAQALVELLSSVQQSVPLLTECSVDFSNSWETIQVDASTPIPFCKNLQEPMDFHGQFWETAECWTSSDSGWDVWTGTVDFFPVEWKTPSMSSVRTLMDGGDGPPMLRVGDTVVRGLDWDKIVELRGDDDGKDVYDAEKASRGEGKRSSEKVNETEESHPPESSLLIDGADPTGEHAQENEEPPDEAQEIPVKDSNSGGAGLENEASEYNEQDSSDAKKAKKLPSPKLPIGIVLSIEPWNGIPAKARRVRWSLTGKEGVYRYGGDGGLFDLCHVEVNSKGTRIKKRHPLPESSEQCAARHGFGVRASHSVLLRLRRRELPHPSGDSDELYSTDGVLEWPDFGSGIRIRCTHHRDGSVSLQESQLLFGSKDSGWISRFGQPSYVPGCTTRLYASKHDARKEAKLDKQISESPCYEELVGRSNFVVDELRNPADGKKLTITSEMRLYRRRLANEALSDSWSSTETPLPPPIRFDRNYHASALSLSRDGRTVSCVSSDGGRCSAFASMGFTKGVHYWEVKLEQADVGSVFIGVAEKPIGSGSGSSYCYDSPPRLTRWHGWGFVNFRATYTSGAERIFGSHCHSGDTVGVLLDCDAGRVSFFFDGLKYGEHILNDLGCAFENLSPFGFSVDGCGSGGAGQSAPGGFESGPSSRLPAQGTIRPRTLWPVIGLRNQGDRVTLSSKWNTSLGIDGVVSLRNIIAVDKLLNAYSDASHKKASDIAFSPWFIEESFSEYKRWISCRWSRSVTRGSGPFSLAGTSLDVYFDVSPLSCAAASAILGLNEVLLSGDRIKLTRSAGRILELAEEAVVLGAYQGRLYYRIVSQKSEGGSLNEGGGRAWCWDESEVVDHLPFVLPSKGHGIALPKLSRFTCESLGGLRVVYENGAVLRSDLEIFDASVTLGTIPAGTIILPKEVIDRRVNSCGVVRFRIRYAEIGEGWISARIRGGTEELIVETVEESDTSSEGDKVVCYSSPLECATVWYEEWKKHQADVGEGEPVLASLDVDNVADFQVLLSQACIPGMSMVESDEILVSYMNETSNFLDSGDSLEIPFQQVASALSFALSTNDKSSCVMLHGASAAANQAAAAVFARFKALPTLHAIMARLAALRTFNRRAKLALPWLPVRPCQEGSAILGGLFGHGTTPDRVGRARMTIDDDYWIQVPSIATKLRSLRRVFFTSVKRDFVQSIVDATTTPTPLSHDEYELPREIRTVRINRLKAGRAMLSDDRSAKRKYSVFAQLQNETKNWGGAGLRRGYVAKGHGGQKRAFKVKLIGEGVNDYSGPYREAFTDAMTEVLRTDEDGRCPLGVLDATPNSASSIGENRDLFMFSLNGRKLPPPTTSNSTEDRVRRSFASLLVPRDESSREVEESLVFLGRLTGTAFRHGIPLDIPLPMASVWKALTEEPVPARDKLRELDELAFRQLDETSAADDSPLLMWQQRMLNAFAEGLGNVLPIEILPLLTGAELRDAMCGNPDVDVNMLQQVVEYEGYTADDDVIRYFWDTLHGMSNEERKQFLQFVWARNRLPMRGADFDAPFKIQKDPTKSDQALPSASTCFFTLTLPEYSSQERMRDKLLFAIQNVTTMETDFQTNSAEIAEGYRSF